jgi:hypothetical protein
MSLAIALTNKEGKHASFVLLAGVAEDYRRTSGEWQRQCVFMALPTEPAMLSDAAYLELADRSSTASIRSTSPMMARLSASSPDSPRRIWRVGHDSRWGTDTVGHAIYAT